MALQPEHRAIAIAHRRELTYRQAIEVNPKAVAEYERRVEERILKGRRIDAA